MRSSRLRHALVANRGAGRQNGPSLEDRPAGKALYFCRHPFLSFWSDWKSAVLNSSAV
jgi:hypothetical protein